MRQKRTHNALHTLADCEHIHIRQRQETMVKKNENESNGWFWYGRYGKWREHTHRELSLWEGLVRIQWRHDGWGCTTPHRAPRDQRTKCKSRLSSTNIYTKKVFVFRYFRTHILRHNMRGIATSTLDIGFTFAALVSLLCSPSWYSLISEVSYEMLTVHEWWIIQSGHF